MGSLQKGFYLMEVFTKILILLISLENLSRIVIICKISLEHIPYKILLLFHLSSFSQSRQPEYSFNDAQNYFLPIQPLIFSPLCTYVMITTFQFPLYVKLFSFISNINFLRLHNFI